MPVLGHAFVGLATGIATRKNLNTRTGCTSSPTEQLWLPATLLLAYLPDISTQALWTVGYHHARVLSHCLLFALAVSLVLTPCLAAFFGLPRPKSFAIILFSVLVHDLLDLLQSTDRVPLWPFSTFHFNHHFRLLPTNAWLEAVIFGSAFLLFLLLYHVMTDRKHICPRQARTGSKRSFMVWTGRAIIAIVIIAAIGTHYLRSVREKQFLEAKLLLKSHEYQKMLLKLNQAGLWPSTAKPGRLDYLRAVAYQKLGDRVRAEQYFLRSYKSDPQYFWCVVDLALFYASAPKPPDQRCRLAMPYLNQLRKDFAAHPQYRNCLKQIRQKLRPCLQETKEDCRKNIPPGQPQ